MRGDGRLKATLCPNAAEPCRISEVRRRQKREIIPAKEEVATQEVCQALSCRSRPRLSVPLRRVCKLWGILYFQEHRLYMHEIPVLYCKVASRCASRGYREQM